MRRATWILWLMLALLPLRGWAGASMAIAPWSAGDASSVVAADVADGGAHPQATVPAQTPCHIAAGDTGGAPDGSKCQSCDWCHAALGLAPRTAAATSPPRSSEPPAALAERDTGRAAIDGLERPPRPRPA